MDTLPLHPYRTVTELEASYRSAHRPVERSRWHILWLKAKGYPPRQIADATGYNRNTISTLVRRYNQHGPEAVRDKRQDNHSDPALTPDQQRQLSEALMETPPRGGVWTSGTAQAYIYEHFAVAITEVCAWGYLKRLGFSVQLPRPRHHLAADPDVQAAFKKK
ncbi:winged helix-turn-helix domain-containing protein [Deinococcus koreensis]|uniref:Winged helix-turn helix domain-containing protein n=1 Tax=Deinococcus koreensis TaxID=2054903 RepID=A0A2K3UZW3_9DEIO|nr:winged helix-turn-helix domain-containing protein [Deinococcus koreensis]PNY80576.1 hypothetical protein CVO96_03630 [Deinococcus koreensis]PNY80785.1 hypothetical protein CVO96_04835 [Deinococcus koreensis]PNY80946.1 hypothetical protein CVO96_05780 [Deinococcus koreensis]PNY81628.1 hypothetical protein CVO96_09805 [Deinococcus koreensis]PNY82074.1 hypothetical protein CVO96_12480 [Deinococcus koreensis]